MPTFSVLVILVSKESARRMYCCWELGVIAVGLNCYLRNVKGYLGRELCKERSYKSSIMFLFVAKDTATIVLEKQFSNRNRSSVCFRMSEIGRLIIKFNVHKFTLLWGQRVFTVRNSVNCINYVVGTHNIQKTVACDTTISLGRSNNARALNWVRP